MIAEGVRRHVVLGLTKPIAIAVQRISAMPEDRRLKFAFGQRCGTFGPWWVDAPRRCRTRRPPDLTMFGIAIKPSRRAHHNARAERVSERRLGQLVVV